MFAYAIRNMLAILVIAASIALGFYSAAAVNHAHNIAAARLSTLNAALSVTP